MLEICGELSLLPNQYYEMTIGEIVDHYNGYNIRQSRDWERARFIAWMAALPYRDKNKPFTQYDIMELPTDPTEEEKAEIAKQKQVEYDQLIIDTYDKFRKLGYNV